MNMENDLDEVYERLKNVIHTYTLSLDKYTKEQLRYKQSENRWSLGEMYNHVINAMLNIYFPAIVACIKQPEDQAKFKTDAGNEIFNSGEYPPTKAKTVNIPDNTDDEQFLRAGLQKVLEQAENLLPIVRNSEPDAKLTHRRLGALNAKEWFQLAEMHSRHHLRQKKNSKIF